MRYPRAGFTFLTFLLLMRITANALDSGKTLRVSDLPAAAQARISRAVGLGVPAELTASDGVTSSLFGLSVAVSGSTVVVGAPSASVNGVAGVGAVYIFVKPATGWENMTQVAKLTASNGGYATELGGSVAISNDTIVAGAVNVATSETGPAYVFTKPSGGWTDMNETAQISASDGYPYNAFGNSVAISGNTIVAGSGGGAYIYVRPAGGWTSTTQTAKLTEADDFGLIVAIEGNTIVVGDLAGNGGLGSVYVFLKPAGGWSNTSAFDAELTASDGAVGAQFGFALAISGGTIVVGSPQAHGRGQSPPGAVYVYVETVGGWTTTTETAQLTVTNEPHQELGYSVGVNGRRIVAGAPDAKAGTYGGLSYMFDEPATGWASTSSFTNRLAAGSGIVEGFGFSIAFTGSNIVVGGPGTDIGSEFAVGAAFVYGP